MSDIHDAITRYAESSDNPDFEYSARQIRALTRRIVGDPDKLTRAIAAMASEEMNAPHAFAHALAPQLPDPLGAFELAVAALDASGNRAGTNFVAALLSALDHRLADKPDDLGTLVAIAKKSPVLSADPIATDDQPGPVATTNDRQLAASLP